MEHLHLKPMQGSSVKEKTAVTMKTIKQLLEEERARVTQLPQPLPVQPELKASVAPTVEAEKTMPPMPQPVISKAASFPPISPAPGADLAQEPTQKSRSLFGRLIGK